jgi:hypothetical protein
VVKKERDCEWSIGRNPSSLPSQLSQHSRLEAMQSNLQTERKLLQERAAEELSEMRRKMTLLEDKEMHEIKRRADEMVELQEMKRQFEVDKKEFAAYVA